MEKNIYLSIVIPAYKEENRLHIILEAIIKYGKTKDFEIETVVVVDGSPDKTAEVARSFSNRISNFKIIDRKENRGKGYSVREGVLAALGKFILFADADNSTPIEQADKLLKDSGKYDVVIGSRYNNGGREATPQPLVRILGGRTLNLIIQMLAVPGIKDTQCGFKLFKHDPAREIFKRMTFERFSFDIEILAIAKKLGYKIREEGIIWYDNPHSTVNPLGDGFRMISDAWQVCQNLRRNIY